MLFRVKGTGRIHGSHQMQCLWQAIRKPELAKCNPVSISHPTSPGLKLFCCNHPHTWCWAHAIPALYHLLNLFSSFLFWQYSSPPPPLSSILLSAVSIYPSSTVIRQQTILLLMYHQKVTGSLILCYNTQIFYHLTSSQEEEWVQYNEVFWERNFTFT